MNARDEYVATFLAAFRGDTRSEALACACLAERWADVTHAVEFLGYGKPWRGGAILIEAKNRLWLTLRGHAVRGAIDEDALLFAVPHHDEGGGSFWMEVIAGYSMCLVNGLNGVHVLSTLSSTETPVVIEQFYTAIRMVACWKTFGDERDYDEDPEIDAAIRESDLFAAEIEFGAALADRLGTSGASASHVASLQMWMSQRRWDHRVFILPGFWRP